MCTNLLAAEQIRQYNNIIPSLAYSYCAGFSQWSSGFL